MVVVSADFTVIMTHFMLELDAQRQYVVIGSLALLFLF